MINTKIRNVVSAMLGAFAVSVSGGAIAEVDYFLLPTPENNTFATYQNRVDATGTLREAIVINNVAVAFKYDDFWSYSAPLLEKIQTVSPAYLPAATFGAYDFSTGTGTIDINLTSVAGGATNVVGPLTFQDPADLASNQQVTGWQCSWGGSTQSCAISGGNDPGYTSLAADVGGVTTVGNLLTYLQGIDPTWSVPVIYADYNQTGGGDSLWFSAKVEIIDPSTGLPVASWQLDRQGNAVWDQTLPTYNFGAISFLGSEQACIDAGVWNPVTGVGCAGFTADGAVYDNLDHNLGSGHADFVVFAPDMDLSKYASNFLFVVTGNLGCIPGITSPYPGSVSAGCNTNGGEEFGIFGGVGALSVPEPGSLALLGAGLGLLGWRSRRQRK